MSFVVSVEHVVLNFGTTDTQITTNLTNSQTQSKCVPMFITVESDEDTSTADGSQASNMVEVEIIDNSGTPAVRGTRSESNSTALNVSVYVIEFGSDINVYSGSYNSSASDTINETVTAVTLANAFVVGTQQFSTTDTGLDDDCNFRIYLSSTTNVQFSRYSTGTGTTSGTWYVVEDNTGGDHFTVDHRTHTFSGGATSATDTITSVTTSKAFLIVTWGCDGTGHYPDENSIQTNLSSSTQVQFRRSYGSGTAAAYMAYQVVELQGSNANVVRGDNSIVNTTNSANHALGSTFGTLSAAHIPGASRYYGAIRSDQFALADYADTKIRCQIDAQRDGVDILRDTNAGNFTSYYSWEAVDFGDPPEWKQEGFRFRKDDGSESAASWLAAQDTNVDILRSNQWRLRILTEETGGVDGASGDDAILQYKGVSRYPTDWVNVPVGSTAIPDAIAGLDAVAYENTANPSYTISAGDNRCLIVFIGIEHTSLETPTSVTWGGQALTRIGGDDAGTTTYAQIHAYYLNEAGIAAGVGSTLSISGLTNTPAVSIRSFENVKQGVPWGSSSSNNSDTTTNPITNVEITAADKHATIAGAIQGNTELTGVSWGATGGGVALTEHSDGGDHIDIGGTPIASLATAERINTSGSNETHEAEPTWSTTPNRSAIFQVLLEPAEAPIYVSPSANITDGANTTAQLTAPATKTTGDFDGGKIWDADNVGSGVQVLANEYREDEWCLKANTAYVDADDAFDFRVVMNGTALNTYTVTPRATLIDVVQKSVSDTLSVSLTESAVLMNIATYPDKMSDKETGLIITGQRFEATQGTGKVELCTTTNYDSGTKTTQTVTAWADGSITLTGVLPSGGPGTYYLFVTNDSGDRAGPTGEVIVYRETEFEMALTSNYTDGSGTAQKLTSPTGGSSGFISGKLVETTNTSTGMNPGADDFTEFEYCIKALEAAPDDQQYEFRLVLVFDLEANAAYDYEAELDTYSQTARYTIQSTIPKAGSDTLSVSVTESDPANALSSGRSDTLTLSLTEAQSLFGVMARSDAIDISIDEITQIFNAPNVTDSIDVSLDEITAILVTVARSDTLDVSITELADVFKFVMIAAADTLSLSISEVTSLADTLLINVFDYLQVDFPDKDYTWGEVEANRENDNINALFKFLYQADDITIGDFDTFENNSFGWDEVTAVVVDSITPVAVSDTLTASITEAVDLLAMWSRIDQLDTSITEQVVNALTSSRADTLSVQIAGDTQNILSLSRSDTLSAAVVGATIILVTLARTDTISASIDEVTTILTTLARTDTLDTTLTELVTMQKFIERTDNLDVTFVEAINILVRTSQSDDLDLSFTEAVALLNKFAASDTLSVAFDDVARLLWATLEAYRWRDDDGDEAGASWLAGENTTINRAKALNTRLRVLLDTSSDTDALQLLLQYRRVGDPDWEWRDVE